MNCLWQIGFRLCMTDPESVNAGVMRGHLSSLKNSSMMTPAAARPPGKGSALVSGVQCESECCKAGNLSSQVHFDDIIITSLPEKWQRSKMLYHTVWSKRLMALLLVQKYKELVCFTNAVRTAYVVFAYICAVLVQYINTSYLEKEKRKLKINPKQKSGKSTKVQTLHSLGESVLPEGWLRSHKLCDKTPSSAKPLKHAINHGDAGRISFQTWVIDKLEKGEEALFPFDPLLCFCPNNKSTVINFYLYLPFKEVTKRKKKKHDLIHRCYTWWLDIRRKFMLKMFA